MRVGERERKGDDIDLLSSAGMNVKVHAHGIPLFLSMMKMLMMMAKAKNVYFCKRKL